MKHEDQSTTHTMKQFTRYCSRPQTKKPNETTTAMMAMGDEEVEQDSDDGHGDGNVEYN